MVARLVGGAEVLRQFRETEEAGLSRGPPAFMSFTSGAVRIPLKRYFCNGCGKMQKLLVVLICISVVWREHVP
jgi:hypothetical protein